MDLRSMGETLAKARFEMHVLSPDGFPLYAITDADGSPSLTVAETDRPVIWELVGQDSAEFRRNQATLFNWSQKNGKKKVKFTEVEQKTIETVASGIVGWRNTIWEGNDLPFTMDNVMTVLAGYSPGKEQANEEIVNRANFFKSA